MLIGGKLEDGSIRFDVLNSATEQVIASVPDATQGDLDRAIAHSDAFKRLLTAEQGKPHGEAEGDVMSAGYWMMGAATSTCP